MSSSHFLVQSALHESAKKQKCHFINIKITLKSLKTERKKQCRYLHEKLDSIKWSSDGFSSSSDNSTGEKQCSIFRNKCDDDDRVVKKLSRCQREFVVRFGLEGMVVVVSVKVKVELLKRWLGETTSLEVVVKLGMLCHVATVLFVEFVIRISLMVLVLFVLMRVFGYAHIKNDFLPTIFQQLLFFIHIQHFVIKKKNYQKSKK